MSVELEGKDLINTQQMEVAVNGPDGATHLILCTGIADLGSVSHESFTFFVGPQLSRRQFVGVIASGALSKIEADHENTAQNRIIEGIGVNLLIQADFDDESGRVQVGAKVSSGTELRHLSVSYNVYILAELPMF
jgi:hypothetical protein